MLYYVLIILATICFGGQFMVVNGYQKQNGDTLRSSLVLSAFEGLIASIIFFAASGFKPEFTMFSVLMAIMISFVGILCSIAGIKTLSLGSISIYTLFIMGGGMIVPFIVGAIFLGEKVTIMRIAGMILMILMLVVPIFTEKDEKKRSKKDRIIFYCLASLLFLCNGLVSAITKIHQVNEMAVGSLQFTTLYFGFLSLFSFAAYIVFSLADKKKNASEYKPLINRYGILYGFLFAIINGGGSFLNVLCAKHISATAQFPIVTGGTIIFSAILGRLIFKEKMTKVQIIQLIIALIATILFIF